MLVIGSQAMKHWGLLPEGVEPKDTDIICTFEEFKAECARIKAEIGIVRCVPLSDKKFHVRDSNGWNYEFEIAWPGSSGADLLDWYEGYATPEVLYALKMSHRYLKDSPHFLKTMRTIQHLRTKMFRKEERLAHSAWFKKREAETYVYKHPKLDVSKGQFFSGDGVNYVYDHDSIHETVALLDHMHYDSASDSTYTEPRPAYTFYMQDGAAVMTDKEKFFAVPDKVRLYGVYEEACVLALERSQIPHNLQSLAGPDVARPTPRWSFEMALMKVCTSITSGWFREWAWENYDRVLDLYNQMGEDDYLKRFQRNAHLLKPFEGSLY